MAGGDRIGSSCLAIKHVVEAQAAQLIAGRDWTLKVNVSLASYNIPKDEFADFVNNHAKPLSA